MGVQCYSNKKRNNDKKWNKDIHSTYSNSIIINSNLSQNIDINKKMNMIMNMNMNNKQENIDENIYEILLKNHNKYRKKYGAPNLELNYELCQLAQEYADKCADLQNIDLNPVSYKNECIGENISEFDGDISTTLTICENWANERNNFDFRNKEYNGKTKHFTQMIWKDTQIVGFGFSSSSNGKNYFVSFYFPAGNIFDEFDNNI